MPYIPIYAGMGGRNSSATVTSFISVLHFIFGTTEGGIVEFGERILHLTMVSSISIRFDPVDVSLAFEGN